MSTNGIITLWSQADDKATYEDYRLTWDVLDRQTMEILGTYSSDSEARDVAKSLELTNDSGRQRYHVI